MEAWAFRKSFYKSFAHPTTVTMQINTNKHTREVLYCIASFQAASAKKIWFAPPKHASRIYEDCTVCTNGWKLVELPSCSLRRKTSDSWFMPITRRFYIPRSLPRRYFKSKIVWAITQAGSSRKWRKSLTTSAWTDLEAPCLFLSRASLSWEQGQHSFLYCLRCFCTIGSYHILLSALVLLQHSLETLDTNSIR